MPTLTITDDAGKETVRVRIRNLDPSDTTVAILGALKPLPEVPTGRKTRSDKGKPKPKKSPAGGTAAPPIPVDSQ